METMYELRIEIDELKDGSGWRYVGTSPDLEGLIVVGDTVEEILAAAPGVARGIIDTLRDHGQAVPTLPEARSPWQTQILIPA